MSWFFCRLPHSVWNQSIMNFVNWSRTAITSWPTRNKNVLVIGGSGSGKTRFFVKPNLMQCVSKDYPTSFVITDPKGSLIGEVGQLLVRCGYRVKVLNTINFSKSMRYNPFRYIHSEKDILKLVNTCLLYTSKTFGPAIAPSLLTWPTIITGISNIFAQRIMVLVPSLTWVTLPGEEFSSV